ncbi:MAG: hypothetical protein KQH63_05790 [Desulfobulbaceae bacterium]|nr:hypothetical protein [Desulfobulbaceae bacterium]
MKKVFSGSELKKDSVIRNFRITESDGKNYNIKHRNKMQDFGKGDVAQKPTVKKCLIVQAASNRRAWREAEEVWSGSV